MISVLLASALLTQEAPAAHWSDSVKVVVLVSADQKLDVNYRSLKALRTLQEEREWEVYKPVDDVAYILDTDSTGIAMSKGLSDMADEIEAAGALGPKSVAFATNIASRVFPKESFDKVRQEGTCSIGFGSQVVFESGRTTVLTSPFAKPSAPVQMSTNPNTRKYTFREWLGFLSTRAWGLDEQKNAKFSASASTWAAGKIAAATAQNEFSIKKLYWLFNEEGYKNLEAQRKDLKTAKDLVPFFPGDNRLSSFGNERITLLLPAVEIRISIPGDSVFSYYLIR